MVLGYLGWGGGEQVSVDGGAPAAGARLGLEWNGMSGMLTGAFRRFGRLFPTLRVTLKLKAAFICQLTTVTFTPQR